MIEENEIDAFIAQARKTVAAIKAAHAKGSALGDEERAALRVEQQTTVAMLLRFVEHRPHPGMTDEQALEMATVFLDLFRFSEEAGHGEVPMDELMATADRLMKLRKPDAH
jgi:hypothetical protein